MYQLTSDPDCIINLETGASIPRGHRWWDEYERWRAEGNFPEPVPAPTFDQVVRAAIDGVQAWIDATAAQNGYDNAVSCASYADSGVPRYRADAAAIIAWRDAVWVAANEWRNSLGGRLPDPVPSIEAIIEQLPRPQAFGWAVHDDGADPGSETGEQS
jgi:hypothetical protein